MTQTVSHARNSRVHKALMMSCATAAMAAAALMPQRAHAQAFVGTPTTQSGTVSYSRGTPGSETVTIGSNTATINWSPTNQQQGGGPIDFLPAGNTATFTSAQGVTDYTVLNRILPDSGQAIALNGHVISTLQGTNATGGHVWFYAPGGIVVGATAVFDVGGLLLTTNDVTSFGTSASGFNGTFSGPSGSTSKIEVDPGAQINALQQNSYVAMVAPRIEQGGTVRVNGSAAYVAAEQATLTMNQGLFDIQVDVGTSDPNGIVHTGETSGPANAAAGDNHSIYMVAVPKNQALTMLLSGGRLGFDDATSASVQNGQIVLSAGYNLNHLDSGGAVFDGLGLGDNIGGQRAGMTIAGGKYSSSVTGAATGDIMATGGGGTLEFDGNLNLQGLRSSTLLAQSGDTITVGGSATISADDQKTGTVQGEETVDANGGIASILSSSGGSISISGDALVSAFALGTVNTTTGELGVANGGSASIGAEGGSIAIGGNSKVMAIGNGWTAYDGYDGRNAFGGTALVTAADGGTVALAGTLEVNADGDGSFSSVSSAGRGGDGIGGYAALTSDSNASIHVSGGTIVSATGYGGGIINSVEGTNGTGEGGEADVSASSGGSISMGGDLGVSGRGFGTPYGNPALQTPVQGGEGDGGSTDLFLDGGTISVAGNAWFGADGLGGAGQAGGTGYGGSSTFEIAGGEGFSQGGNLSVMGSLTLQAEGVGGAGSDNPEGNGGQGGDGYAGYASFYVTPDFVEGATTDVSLGSLSIAADATGGNGGNGITGGNGGNAYAGYNGGAGETEYFVSGSARFEMFGGTATVGNMFITADARGGNGGAASGGTGGAGGTGEGGSASIEVSNASLTANNVNGAGRGFGGNGGSSANGVGGDGGSGQGGTFDLYVDAGGNLSANTYVAYGNGMGGNAGSGTSAGGTGGAGQSGYDNAYIDGTVTVGGSSTNFSGFIVTSFAQGGIGDTGGSATAGSSSITVNGSLTSAGLVQATAQAGGGNGITTGGSADGGSSSIDVNGHLTTDTLTMLTNAFGGSGASNGGYAEAGSTELSITGGAMKVTTSGVIQAKATGGNASAGTGGSASGGSVLVYSFDGASLTGGSLSLNADATGGNGFAAGGGDGGNVFLLAQTLNTQAPATMTVAQLNTSANGFAGTGAPSEAASSGGSIGILDAGSTISANSLSMTANGTNSGGWDAIQLDTDYAGNPGTMQFGSVNAQANGGDTGGQIFLSSATGGTLGLGDATLQASGGFGGAITLLTGYCFECGGGDTTAETALSNAAGGITANSLSMNTTGSISVTLSGGGDLAVSGTLNGTAGQMISLVDDGSGGAIRAHEIDLSAITIDDSADIVADIINFTTAGYMTLGDLSASQTLSLTAGSDLTTGNLSAANSLTLNAGGDANLGSLSAQTVKVTAAANSSVGNVNAPGSATFTAGGVATFTGAVSSPTITVTSSDLDVAEGASLGVSGVTNLLTLNAISHGLPIVIGDDGSSGNGASGQYHLNEDGDIRATSVVINAQGAVSGFNPDVQVFDTNIEGSATQGGGITNVTLNTAGSVFVTGLVGFTDAGTNDSLTINAGRAIEVNTDTGGIEIVDGTGALTGVLTLKADNIWAASGSILSQLESDVNFSGRNTALGVNSGTANPNGFVRAGTIHASVADSFLVQNTNTADLFGGVDTGNGGLSIASTGTTPAALIVYGRQTNSNGTVITNQAFLGSVNVSGNGGFTTDSSVNGCAIGSDCGQTQPASPQFDMASILGPLNETNSPSDEDKKKKDKDNGDSDDGSNADPSLKLINTTPINTNRPIDDPVTSGGDVVVGGNAQPN